MMLKRNDWGLVLQSLKSDGVFLSALASLYFMTSFVHSFSWVNLWLIAAMVFLYAWWITYALAKHLPKLTSLRKRIIYYWLKFLAVGIVLVPILLKLKNGDFFREFPEAISLSLLILGPIMFAALVGTLIWTQHMNSREPDAYFACPICKKAFYPQFNPIIFPENILSKQFTGQKRFISLFSLKCPECRASISAPYEKPSD